MRLLAAWAAHPIEYPLWLGFLAALVAASTVAAAVRLRRRRAAGLLPDPFTSFLAEAPKSLGTIALLLGAFAFVLEIDLAAAGVAWGRKGVTDDPEYYRRTAGLLLAGGLIAAAGFLASWTLALFLGPPEDDDE